MTINQATINLMQQIQTPALTTFSKIISTLAEPIYLLIIAIIISAFLYAKSQKSKAILLASASIITALAIKILKATLQIERPTSALIQETGYSFPSGHATFAIVFFGLLTYIFAKKQNKIPAIIISTLLITIITLTRLYLQVHWLTDIIAGIIIGTAILITAILIHKKIQK